MKKCQKHHLQYHQQEHCIHLSVHSKINICWCMTQRSQSLTLVINRTSKGQLQSFFPKLMINGSKESYIRIYQYTFKISIILCWLRNYCQKYAKEHNLFQLAEDSMFFTDHIDLKCESLYDMSQSTVFICWGTKCKKNIDVGHWFKSRMIWFQNELTLRCKMLECFFIEKFNIRIPCVHPFMIEPFLNHRWNFIIFFYLIFSLYTAW